MTKQQAGIDLRAVGGESFVNVGTGNITHVAAGLDWNGDKGTRITFIGGHSHFVGDVLETVVQRLRGDVGGFGR